MTKPPASPTSSDIAGVNRDGAPTIARGKPADPDQQEKLADLGEQNSARPAYDPEIAPKGNAQ